MTRSPASLLVAALLLLVAGCPALRGGARDPGTPVRPLVLFDQPVGAAPSPAPATLMGPARAGVVAAAHPLAAEAGAEMLRRGGSAFDAAVATALVLGVVNPQSSGVGGGGFAVFRHEGGDVSTLDFREAAPAYVTPQTYSAHPERSSERGAFAVGIPGEIAGLGALHALGGLLPFAEVVEPARRLAAEGFSVGSDLALALASTSERVLADPGMRADFAPGGRVLLQAETCRRTALARTLEYLQLHGPSAFYAGPVAASMVGFLAQGGAPVTEADFAAYLPRTRAALQGRYRGQTIYAMGPPSSGGIATLQVLGLLERAGPASVLGTPAHARGLTWAFAHAFADRATYGGDPDHVHVPVSDLLAAPTLDALAARTPKEGPLPQWEAGLAGLRGDSRGLLPDDGGTSHLSVLDAAGNAVALTTTVNLWFGAAIVDPQTGVLFNDQLDDFATRAGEPNAYGLVQGENNAPAAGRRPLSSMSPTLVLDEEGRTVLAVGGAGGPRIITATLQTLLAALDGDLSAVDAVAAPRLHHQWLPLEVAVEDSYPAAGRAALVSEGFAVSALSRSAIVQIAQFDPVTGRFLGAADPRAHGAAVVVFAGSAP